MPHTLRRVGTDDETVAGLTGLAGYDDDLAASWGSLPDTAAGSKVDLGVESLGRLCAVDRD